ncbi:hypothetical protein L0337_38280 [candidate division KSB1 bacterium]|nr:hypothetical protein [candidate division KSB1 bacterium]
MLRKIANLSLIMGVFALAGCNNDEPSKPAAPQTLQLSLNGVQPLVNGYHYEGWALIGGSPVATGKFNVNASGTLVSLSGNIIANGEFQVGRDLSGTTAIVITIEPNNDSDPGPTATHYLAGDVANAAATLTAGHAAALANNFSTAAGKYILATPTDTDNTNEKSGIWFLELTTSGPARGLTLPTLPAGWAYEGWAVINGTPVTTGRFTNPAGADLSAPFSGPQGAPPFPGEDFLKNAPAGLAFPTNLSGGMAVISIEPEPDDSPAPFTLKPLIGVIPANSTDHFTYSMNNQAAGNPTGTATIK